MPLGTAADADDRQLLSNGDYLVGAYVDLRHVDTSGNVGSSDATVTDADIQQVSSTDHQSETETSRPTSPSTSS